MKKYNYYLYDGETYYEDKKNLKFISVKDPNISISYCTLHPDEVDRFKEILPNEKAKAYRTAPEKLYRILTDIKTVMYLTEDSFFNISKQVNGYLEEIEDYERMCVIRDIDFFYKEQRLKKKAQIDDYIKHFNKMKK